MTETPHPAAVGGPQKITFQDLWNECDNQRTRYGITRAELLRQASESDQKSEAMRADIRAAAAERGRLVDAYDALARLIERVRDDDVILDRLRWIAAEEARASASDVNSDEVSADD